MVATREESIEVYGQLFKTYKDDALLALLKQKMTLLEHLFKTNGKYATSRKVDSLVNIINYALFLLQNKLDEESKNGN